jgi:hypothetical protein
MLEKAVHAHVVFVGGDDGLHLGRQRRRRGLLLAHRFGSRFTRWRARRKLSGGCRPRFSEVRVPNDGLPEPGLPDADFPEPRFGAALVALAILAHGFLFQRLSETAAHARPRP